jgi:hypothetical protein
VRCVLGSCQWRSCRYLRDAGRARVQVVDGVRARLLQATKPGAVVLKPASPVPVVVLVAAVPFLAPAVPGPARRCPRICSPLPGWAGSCCFHTAGRPDDAGPAAPLVGDDVNVQRGALIIGQIQLFKK